MFTKKMLAVLFAVAMLVPLAGCRHCCKRGASSFAPDCCPPATVLPPPPSVLPPGP